MRKFSSFFKRKFKRHINFENSYMGVQCDAVNKCSDRFSSICNLCEHNCGRQRDLSYFKRIDL